MENKLTATANALIELPASTVWHALTDPDMIKHYLYGTETESDWKKGSPIVYKGEWEGKYYEDKGVIVDIQPEKLLHTTYYSPLSGKEDKPEHYDNVIYSLSEKDNKTMLVITQDNIPDEEGKTRMENNWKAVLESLKQLLEK